MHSCTCCTAMSWRGRWALAALAAGVGASALAGCAGTAPAAIVDAPTDPLACGLVVSLNLVELGDELFISRAAAPAAQCPTLAPGSEQKFAVRSTTQGGAVGWSDPVVVAPDGSLEATITVPLDTRAGQVLVTAVPPAELDCSSAPDDSCILPRLHTVVGFDPSALSPVHITSTDTPTPTLPDSTLNDLVFDSYFLAGPETDELTVVVFGSGCETRPLNYVAPAPHGTLQLVSGLVGDPLQDCDAGSQPWTTVIEVPTGFEQFESVTVDNLAARDLG